MHRCTFTAACRFDLTNNLPPMVGLDPDEAQHFNLRSDEIVLLCTVCSSVYRQISNDTIERFGTYSEQHGFEVVADGPVVQQTLERD
jgi:hypothetical protein